MSVQDLSIWPDRRTIDNACGRGGYLSFQQFDRPPTVLKPPRPSPALPPSQVPANWAVLQILAQSRSFLGDPPQSPKQLLASRRGSPSRPNPSAFVPIASPETLGVASAQTKVPVQ